MLFEVFNIDSKYYIEMMNIILKAKNNPPEKGELHHIIPRCWYIHYNFNIDNSISNTVLLTWEDHKLVHKLAYKCVKEHWLKTKLACAAHCMGDKEIKYHHSEETRKKMSEALKGKSKGKGKIPWNKGKKLGPMTEEHKRKISEANKIKYCKLIDRKRVFV